ncbi:phosphate ABC transporter permease PstA [Mucisphaera calidilacus]|uniref:Phosphate transport system permease protein PstA n=1 Tax=Mucisphaera calidilacus TaxID=2527982 RepID=A0A518BVX9_9BACT|nr:phosphate ABC transporter permease PstA [Mucisphaera calidilacus]QDU71128.1 Phosphate transport system permease protein PstA [Mucisphaera calidilacus]
MSKEARQAAAKRKRAHHAMSSLLSRGEPMVWLTAGGLTLALVMVAWLLGLVLFRGMITFWPMPITQLELSDGTTLLGQVTRNERIRINDQLLNQLPEEVRDQATASAQKQNGYLKRALVRTGNYERTNAHFNWVFGDQVTRQTYPEQAVLIERLEWGRFYGTPVRLESEGKVVAEGRQPVIDQVEAFLPGVIGLRDDIRSIERDDIAALTRAQERARLELNATLREAASEQQAAEAQAQFDQTVADINTRILDFKQQIANIRDSADIYTLVLETSDGDEAAIRLMDVVRVVPANQLTTADKLSVYLGRWIEFLTEDPREANSEGGVFPAIFGTVLMTMIMCVLVVPFGVMAALYLREYAKAGFVVSAVRISINNLAGVPSIVFGVFGLGFFCYILGAQIDEIFFSEKLPNPTFGKGALIWASFTLALLTLPVVIVATEEAIAAVPNSMREGSYACGASKWQTIQRIVLPRAMPGILTGTILAMARGAGEVAPLMIVGAVKLAPELPLSLSPSEQFGINRSFMHLGFHIYDLGFQSQNSEAARPMVYTTTLLLILIVAVLNILAIALRSRLRKRFKNAAF